jgi:hypothetical protein
MMMIIIIICVFISFLVRSFYIYWEHELFMSLVEFVLRNLCHLSVNMFGDHRSLLFTVDILLMPSHVKLQPAMEEIVNSIRRSAHNISELPTYFTRWLHGTCQTCPLVSFVDDNIDTPDFTFNRDVRQHPDVVG